MTSKVTYLGDLRTESEHVQSGMKMLTDAPTDNQGRGEAFSPTDTVATALATCMLTIMGIKARDLDLDLRGATALVQKTMAPDPRRISRIEITFTFPKSYGEKSKRIIERAAKTCPVLHSLHPEIDLEIGFTYGEQAPE